MSIFNPDNPLTYLDQSQAFNKKIVSIHTSDRDKDKWKYANNFEVILPEKMCNIQSMRLVTISLPSNQYVFSNEYQNTKLKFNVTFDISGNAAGFSNPNIANATHNYEITIDEGTYTSDQLVSELESKMNIAVDTDASWNTAEAGTYNYFDHYFNKVQYKFMFGNKRDTFKLLFDTELTYNTNYKQPNMWNNYSRWGLPSYLGFTKTTLTANSTSSPYKIDYDDGSNWLARASNTFTNNPSGNVYYSIASNNLDIFGDTVVYMEIDKYNTINELTPYCSNTTSTYNNTYSGKVNSAFAKIPLIASTYGQLFDSRNGFLNNLVVFNTPIPSVDKLKFKFRYHDGRLVDFKGMPFSFSLEFNQLKDAQIAGWRKKEEASFSIAQNKGDDGGLSW